MACVFCAFVKMFKTDNHVHGEAAEGKRLILWNGTLNCAEKLNCFILSVIIMFIVL